MSSVTTTTVKAKVKNKLSRYEKVFFEDLKSAIPSDSLENIDISENTSVSTAATQRIGRVTVEKKLAEVKEIIEDKSIGVKRIGRVTILGDDISTHSIDDFKQGYNVKTLNETACSMLPHLTVNSPDKIDEKGNVINLYENSTFGQLFSYYFNNITDGIDRKNVPFYDYPGRLDPVAYIKKGSYYPAYMIITDNVQDYLHYIEPDSIIHDGGIDVFEVRSQRANTMSADIQTKGIRASICTGPWDLPAGSTTELKKGTSLIVDKIDVRPYEYDFFEDCQDLVFGEKSFVQKKGGATNSSGYKYSLDGYASEGKYLYPPFEDVLPVNVAYQTISRDASNDTLVNAINNNESLRDVSEIGRRFKSTSNGVILRPKYEVVIQSNLGTDSIAFAGYLRE